MNKVETKAVRDNVATAGFISSHQCQVHQYKVVVNWCKESVKLLFQVIVGANVSEIKEAVIALINVEAYILDAGLSISKLNNHDVPV